MSGMDIVYGGAGWAHPVFGVTGGPSSAAVCMGYLRYMPCPGHIEPEASRRTTQNQLLAIEASKPFIN